MRAHYALVDDLYRIEDFERLVAEKVQESGELLDERTAAMLVVSDAGRRHVKIGQMTAASSLICFFGKVLEKEEPRTFERSDGTQGLVARLRVGDESGETRLVLWDERTGAIDEIAVGDVLEIIGRPKAAPRLEVHVLDMRRTACEISTREEAGPAARGGEQDLIDLEARILSVGEVRQFTRRDGSPGEMAEAVICTPEGTARLVVWDPALLEGFAEDDVVRIERARRNSRSPQPEYSIGEQAALIPVDRAIEVPFTPIGEIVENTPCSIRGRITDIGAPRGFTTRNGANSWVRNGQLHDESGEIRLVLWGDRACQALVRDDHVEIYHVQAKKGRNGDMELHAGMGSAIRIGGAAPREVTVEGTVIDTWSGRCIDDGKRCLLIEGHLPLGEEVRVEGLLTGSRLRPLRCERRVPDIGTLKERVKRIIDK